MLAGVTPPVGTRDSVAGANNSGDPAYVFVSLAQLLKDFAKDIERLSGEIK